VSRQQEACTLARSHRFPIALLALLALLVAQAAATVHLLKHLGADGDTTGVPGQHSQVCQACASFAPLVGTHAGPAAALALAVVAGSGLRPTAEHVQSGNRFSASFRARAPPR